MLFQTAMPKSLSAISTDVTKPPTNLFPPASLTDLLILSKRSWKELCAVCFLPSSIKPEQLPQSIGPPWSWSWDSLLRSKTPQAHLLSSTCLGSSAILSFPSVASVPGISAGRAGPHRLQRKRQSQWLGSQRHSYVWAFPWPRAACRHSQFCIPMEKEKENNNNLRNKIKKNWKSDWRSNLFFFFLCCPICLEWVEKSFYLHFQTRKETRKNHLPYGSWSYTQKLPKAAGTLPQVCSHQVVQHPHECFKLLLPYFPFLLWRHINSSSSTCCHTVSERLELLQIQ